MVLLQPTWDHSGDDCGGNDKGGNQFRHLTRFVLCFEAWDEYISEKEIHVKTKKGSEIGRY